MGSVSGLLDFGFLLVIVAFLHLQRGGTHHNTPMIVVTDHTSPLNSSTAEHFPFHSPRAAPTRTLPTQTQNKHRKSVSFSLSTIHSLISPTPSPVGDDNRQRRPPTPYVSGPVSPRLRNAEMKRCLDGEGELKEGLEGVKVVDLSWQVEDPMGVKKAWIMG